MSRAVFLLEEETGDVCTTCLTTRLSPAPLHPHLLPRFAPGTGGAPAPPAQQLSPSIAALCLPSHRGPLALSGPDILPARQESGQAAAGGRRTRTGSSLTRAGAGLGQREASSKTCQQEQRWSCSRLPTETQPQLPKPSGTDPWVCPG